MSQSPERQINEAIEEEAALFPKFSMALSASKTKKKVDSKRIIEKIYQTTNPELKSKTNRPLIKISEEIKDEANKEELEKHKKSGKSALEEALLKSERVSTNLEQFLKTLRNKIKVSNQEIEKYFYSIEENFLNINNNITSFSEAEKKHLRQKENFEEAYNSELKETRKEYKKNYSPQSPQIDSAFKGTVTSSGVSINAPIKSSDLDLLKAELEVLKKQEISKKLHLAQQISEREEEENNILQIEKEKNFLQEKLDHFQDLDTRFSSDLSNTLEQLKYLNNEYQNQIGHIRVNIRIRPVLCKPISPSQRAPPRLLNNQFNNSTKKASNNPKSKSKSKSKSKPKSKPKSLFFRSLPKSKSPPPK